MKLGAIAALMGMMGAPTYAGAMGARNNRTVNRDVVKDDKGDNSMEDEIRKSTGGGARMSGKPRAFMNQRQYRKRCRQNPSSYRSFKHRSRN